MQQVSRLVGCLIALQTYTYGLIREEKPLKGREMVHPHALRACDSNYNLRVFCLL